MTIDILTARNNIQSLLSGLISGTGVSFGDKNIILYIPSYIEEQKIKNIIGNSYEGFPIKFVYSGKVQFLQPSKLQFQ